MKLSGPIQLPCPQEPAVKTISIGLLSAALLSLAACDADSNELLEPDLPESICAPLGYGVTQGGPGVFTNTILSHERQIVLMGGGAENDQAMVGFLQGAAGGDVLILRASGSTTSYPSYFMWELETDPQPNAAVTIRLDEPEAGTDPGVLCKIKHAEAIWLAGGSQWNYVGLWPQTLHEQLQQTITRQITIGGTSAGAMSLGEGVFDAREGSITSNEALADPLSSNVSISLSPLAQPELNSTLIDSHFSERHREGRLIAFLARFSLLTGKAGVRGIGLDEGTALTIDDSGFEVFGPNDEKAIWVYEYVGNPSMTPGEPLTLQETVLKIRIPPGSRGEWPIDMGTWSPSELSVVEGTLTTYPSQPGAKKLDAG